jgi:hypothetical protein
VFKGVCRLLLGLSLAGAISCGAESGGALPVQAAGQTEMFGDSSASLHEAGGDVPLDSALDEIAEVERSGGFVPGLGLAESKVREDAGDYAGAVLAVYKELAWAYALGAADVSKAAIREGLENLVNDETILPHAREEIGAAVRAILAFYEGRYDEAEKLLVPLYGGDEEADGFARFLILACALERGNAGKSEKSGYGAIRARYEGFPEYWYHFARAEKNGAAGMYAERCINLAPEGPYAAECRIILAAAMGLEAQDAPALKTRLEIEAAITEAANQQNPALLSALLPLAALPDNPSTIYACGAMRSLSAEKTFKDWFAGEAEKARGRLAERLLYISRG